MYWSKSEWKSYLSDLTEVVLINRKRFNKRFKCGKRYININILENYIPNINTLKLKCSINEFIIPLNE